MTLGKPVMIEGPRLELLKEPLAWFFAEHIRHRQMCGCVEEVAAAADFDPLRIGAIVDFLRVDLPLHILDEEEDLFPLLYRRALPEDDLDQILGELLAEHRSDLDEAQSVRELLERCLADGAAPGLDAGQRRTLIAFASQERRHLAIENAVVLPIARLRLTRDDLADLSRRLAARRAGPGEAPAR